MGDIRDSINRFGNNELDILLGQSGSKCQVLNVRSVC